MKPIRTAQAVPFQYQPFSKKQLKVLTWWLPQSPYCDHDMIIADGSIRSGKTVSMTESFTMWSLLNFRGQDFIMAGKSSGALERNVLKPMFQMLAAKGIPYQYRRGEGRSVEAGTNKYYCFGANDERSQDVVQGMTSAGFLADEIALMPESFVAQAMGRCSVPGSKFWFNCNPEDPNHFFKKDFIDKAALKRALYLHFTMVDNFSLSPEVRARYERMYTGVFYQRFIAGLWVVAEGAIYKDCYQDKLFIDDPKGLLFDDDTAPKTFVHRWIPVDYGTANPQVYLDCWFDGHILWVMNEYYWDSVKEGRQKSDQEYGDDLVDFVGRKDGVQVIIDPSAASFKVELKKRNFFATESQNDLLDIENANNIVVNGIRFTSTMMNLGRIRIHEKCVNTRREIQTYVWDKKKTEKGKEQPVKKNDHCPDALRYVVFTKMAKAVNWGSLI